MAIGDIIGEVFDRQFRAYLYNAPGLINLAWRREVPAGSDQIRVPISNLSVTGPTTYSSGDFSADSVAAGKVSITLDTEQYTAVEFDMVTIYESFTDLVGDAVRRVAEKWADSYNTKLHTELTGISSGNVVSGGTLSVKTVNYAKADRQKVLDGMRKARLALAITGGNEALQNAYWVVSYQLEDQLATYLDQDNVDFGTGRFSDDAFSSRMLPTIFGAPVVPDKAIPFSGTTASTVYPIAYLVKSQDALAFASGFSLMRLVDIPTRPATQYQVMQKTGAKLYNPAMAYEVTVTTAA